MNRLVLGRSSGLDGRDAGQSFLEGGVCHAGKRLQARADELAFLDLDAQAQGAFFHLANLQKLIFWNGETVTNHFDFFILQGFRGRSGCFFDDGVLRRSACGFGRSFDSR